jgi:ABC-type dipeptide/oligopeptide/nickel transport system ATPase component
LQKDIIQIRDLSLTTKSASLVDNLSLSIKQGEFLSLVGASGSGKTMTSLAIMRLLPPAVGINSGQILFDKQDLVQLEEKALRQIRGNRISMIFQEPMTSLNPVMRVGKQIAEAVLLHQQVSKKEALEIAEQTLKEVMVSDPGARLRSYPHQLSGGLRQRVMIAMALSCNPDLLIADEPTTSLDVTVQAAVMDLLDDIRKKRNLSVLLITHDIALASEVSDRIAVIDKGKIVEIGSRGEIISNPSDPVSKKLIAKAHEREL